jgi:hypothetical protein
MPPAVAALVPIFTAIGASTATATTLATTLIVSTVVSGAEFALGKIFHPSVKQPGTQLTTRNPVSSRRVIYGAIRAGGVQVYITTSADNTSSNGNLHMVVCLAGHEVNDIGDLWIDGVQVPLAINAGGRSDGGWYPTGGKYANVIQVEKHLGIPSSRG